MLTANQLAVLAVLDEDDRKGIAPTVHGLQADHFPDRTTARLAASLNTLVGDGLARYNHGDPTSMFTASYTITDQGRTYLQNQAVEQAEKVRARVLAALIEQVPDLDAYDDGCNFTVTGYGAPAIFNAFWRDEPREEDGFGPERQYWITAAVVTWLDAPRSLSDGYVEVVWADESAGWDTPARVVLPMTFVAAADLGDGEPLARLAVDAIRADRQEG